MSSCWNSSLYPLTYSRVRLKRLLPLRGPERAGLFALVTLELFGHPKQRAEDDGAIIAGQFDDPGFDDETAEFDEMPRALAALDLPRAHIISCPCGLMPVACRPAAPQRRQGRGQLLEQFAAIGPE